MPGRESDRARTALAAERHFVRTLGGFVLGIAGAELVTHERIPIPRFNFVQVAGVDRGRQSAFFERALDHYFQRALRPTFRVPIPEAEHVRAGLVRFGFRPRPHPIVLLIGEPERVPPPPTDLLVRSATNAELDEVVGLVVGEAGRAEFRAAVDVAWHFPNPGERLDPFVAIRGGRIVSVGLRYEQAGTAGLHFITTRPGDRGQGAASALVGGAFAPESVAANAIPFLFADSSRLEQRLRSLGFAPALSFREYALPPEVELAFPPPGPPTPPRWRPPRNLSGRQAT
ncbi:MAG: hypothetical protein WB852_07205 [Thermoplasmata archaeon]